MKEIRVKTLMSEDLTCLPPEAPLKLAVEKMVEQRYSCIIISQDEMPVGIITERDIVRTLNREAQEIDLSLPISTFMSSPILSLNENQSLFHAMVISRAERIRHMPVLNDDEYLVGLVTQSDLANAHFQVIEMQSKMIEESVAAKTDQLEKLNKELQALTMEDHLMRIGNRRAMEVDLGYTHKTAIRYDQIYSVLLMDIDYFKNYNDHYGHQAGDDALRSVADILKANIRGSDRLYRYGGEEILLLLPLTNAAQADTVAKKLVASVAKAAMPHEKSMYKCITISCGGACVLGRGQIVSDWAQLIEQADSNLYKAKNDGRNRAHVIMG
jgi:diguanylate cyclase (GGDEF)-like protein